MKRCWLAGVIAALLVAAMCGTAAYASTNTYSMSYLAGTSDHVDNLHPDDAGLVGGQQYTVTSDVPQRQGYEFICWTLDYDTCDTFTLSYQVTGDSEFGMPGDTATPDPVTGIREGSSQTLAAPLTTAWETADGSPAPTTETYRVNYLEVGTDKVLAPQKVVTNQSIGSIVTEEALDIDGYALVGADTQDLTIRQSQAGRWTFTGWCSDEACTTPITEVTNISADTTAYGKWEYEVIDLAKNEITFYYEVRSVQYVSYTVRYIDIDTGELLVPDVLREGVVKGTLVKEYAKEIDGYAPLYYDIDFEALGDELIMFVYYGYGYVD